jgi:hypothetical protein
LTPAPDLNAYGQMINTVSHFKKAQKDSLFESSKASTNYHRTNNPSISAESKHKKTMEFRNAVRYRQTSDLDNSGIVGSKIVVT